MPLEPVSLSLPIIIGLGLVDSLSPCVIGVLLLLLAVLLKTGDKNLMLKNGLAYTGAVYATYLIAGLSLLNLFNAVRSVGEISGTLYLLTGIFILIVGAFEVKDYFWYGKWISLSIPKRFISLIETRVEKTGVGIAAVMLFGVFTTLVELPCTGAPYVAILTLMSNSGLDYIKGLPLLLLYNFVFVLPLLVIIGVAYYGVGVKRLQEMREGGRGTLRLIIGLALWAVGVWIVTTIKNEWLIPLIFGLVGTFLLMALVYYFGSRRTKEEPAKVHVEVILGKEVVKRSGEKEPFSSEKVSRSIRKACALAGIPGACFAEEATREIIKRLTHISGPIETSVIRKETASTIKEMGYLTVERQYLLHKYL